MKRSFSLLLCLIFACVFALSSVQDANASGTRMKAMGMDPSTYWMIQKDTQTFHVVNPAVLAVYPAIIWIMWNDAAANNVGKGGLGLKPTKETVVYVTTGMPVDSASDLNTTMFQGASRIDGTDLLTKQISAMFAYDLGDTKLGVDLGFSKTAAKEDDLATDETTDYSRSEAYVRGGAMLNLGDGQDLDIAATVTLPTIDNKDTLADYSYKSDGAMIVAAIGRYNMNLDEKSRLHVYVQGKYKDLSTKEDAAGTAVKFERTGIDLNIGVSNELKVNETALAYYGCMIKYSSRELKVDSYKNESMDIDLPLVFGFEANVTENWKARMGAQYVVCNYSTTKETDVLETETITDDAAKATVGVGVAYKFGNLLMEWKIEQALLTDGPNVIGGTAPGMASEFIATYFL